jgi:hypothetical protein
VDLIVITNPTPQRALRGHRPSRPGQRTVATGEYLAGLSPHLTERDRWLARMLYEHKVLTSAQIAAMAWPSARAANLRLLQLYQWRVLDRFQPFVTNGTAPMHYVLDHAGAAILAHEDGLDPRDLGYKHDRALGIAHSLRLAHTVGTNTFFTALVTASRQPNAAGRLTAWWSETRCGRHFGDIVRPDGYGRWTQHGTTIEWFLEYDFGTERPDRVAAKLPRYAQLAATTGIITPVLIHLPSPRREAAIRRALTAAHAELDNPATVPLATTTADQSNSNPTGACWRPLHHPAPGRLRLAELARVWTQMTPPTASAEIAPTATNELLPPPPTAPAASARRPRR